ncbi:hypothetical protein JOC86_001934 [Bacillus pakistanensis]|uniref:Amidohydrolase-related domain-containing protein n=1 Tax=Rossellomorea pakistanensis TaxID=992288 RepID=A0ABS2NC10_9BACI|nr:hypothetical protein [Bacillus pakistanensis]MBM7585392.1 hypothetical protein [Bacillus pakistanensis]
MTLSTSYLLSSVKTIHDQPSKRIIAENGYADLVLLDEKLNVRDVWASGIRFVKDYEVINKGMFE